MAAFQIRVKTGDKSGASTNANVKIRLEDVNGSKSRDIKLDVGDKNALEMVKISGLEIAPKINKIELWRDNLFWWRNPDWFVEYIEVEAEETKTKYIFPINRWVVGNRHYVFQMYDALLPQDDDNKEQREFELRQKKKVYTFYQQEPDIPIVSKNCPPDEKWPTSIKLSKASMIVKTSIESNLTRMKTVFHSWSKVKDIQCIYGAEGSYLDKPKGPKFDIWSDDRWFGAQRLCGIHPVLIKLCTEIPKNFGVTSEMLKPLLEGKTLDDALKSKRMYIVDLKIMKEIGVHNDLQPYGPMALFYVTDDKGFTPVAIQLDQEKGPDNPVFLPNDDPNLWIIAKLWYNMADGLYHQSISHLGYAHLKSEGAAICTHRNLSPSHPVFKLLMPHFHGVFAIDSLGFTLLVADGGLVDASHRVKGRGATETVKAGEKRWKLDMVSNLEKDLEARGVADTEALPNYHYRDDALLVWNATKTYVTKIIELYYSDDEKIKNDSEIQQWGQELVSPYPGGLGWKGVAGEGKFENRQQLSSVATEIIFISSCQHAAANFPQYEEYCFSPNLPTYLRGCRPTKKEKKTERDIMDALPTKKVMLSNMTTMRLLSEKYTDNNLGVFYTQYFHDPKAKETHDEFMKDIHEASGIIKDRNEKREFKYEWLDPEGVPNSIYI